MGFRTVVVLYNDQASEWSKDDKLGEKISHAMNACRADGNLGYGKVVECCHADQITLAVLDSYHFSPVAYSHWNSGVDAEAQQLRLLKEAASKLGYRIVPK